MLSPSLQSNQGVNMDTLQALMDQGTAEHKRSIKNWMETQNQKIKNLSDQRIHNLEKQKNKQWNGALFGFVVNVLSMAAQALNFIAPGVGVIASKAIGMLNQINPFHKQAQDAQLAAEESQGEIKWEEAHRGKMRDYLQRLKEHESSMDTRIFKAVENLEKSQEAAVHL